MENVIIIGGGMAGLSAGIYLARAGLKPLIFAGSPPGGQLTLTSDVENYPGYESILGAELVQKVRKQAEKFGARIIDENVKSVELVEPVKSVEPASAKASHFAEASRDKSAGKLVKTKSIIIATGAKALWLGLESEKRLRGKGVSACATCDGFFFRNKTVAVIGGGDTALEEALTLTKFASKVYLIHRRGEFRASKVMQERVKTNSKIEVIFNASVEDIIGKTRVESVKISINQLKSDRSLKVDGLFVAIGHKPDTDLFKDKILLDNKGYIITSARKAINNAKFLINLISKKAPSTNDKKEIGKLRNCKIGNYLDQLERLEIRNFDYSYQSATSVPGVFAAGDCVDHIYRQASTASGMGVQTALDVERYLEGLAS